MEEYSKSGDKRFMGADAIAPESEAQTFNELIRMQIRKCMTLLSMDLTSCHPKQGNVGNDPGMEAINSINVLQDMLMFYFDKEIKENIRTLNEEFIETEKRISESFQGNSIRTKTGKVLTPSAKVIRGDKQAYSELIDSAAYYQLRKTGIERGRCIFRLLLLLYNRQDGFKADEGYE